MKEELSITLPSMEELEDKILKETDISELQSVIDLFNLNIKKKDIIRTSRLNNLQDAITQQIEDRITNQANQFSNKDLIDYFKTIQDTINRSDTTLDDVKIVPAIQVNTINNIENNLSRESKRRVIDVVSSILNDANKEIVDVDCEKEVEELSNDEQSI